MKDTPKDDDAGFQETVKRMLATPPKPHKPTEKPKGVQQKKPRPKRAKVSGP